MNFFQVRSWCGRLPLGLIGGLAFIVLIELSFSRRWADYSELVSADWRMSNRLASSRTFDCDLLITGDSQVKFGLIPDVLDGKLGTKSYNIATMGAQISTTYFLVRRAIEAGAKPSAIVVDCNDPPLNTDTGAASTAIKDHERNWPELLSWKDLLDLAYQSEDADFLAATTLSKVFPSIRSHVQIRRALMGALLGSTNQTKYTVHAHARNVEMNRGAFVCAKAPADNRPYDPNAIVPKFHWKPNPLTSHFATRLLDLAKEHGITVFWVLPPTSPGHANQRLNDGVWQFTTEFARRLSQLYPELVVIDGRESVRDIASFADLTHLDRDGATMFSDLVARAISDYRRMPVDARPRWLNLPTAESATTQIALEDYAESSTFVMTQHHTRVR